MEKNFFSPHVELIKKCISFMCVCSLYISNVRLCWLSYWILFILSHWTSGYYGWRSMCQYLLMKLYLVTVLRWSICLIFSKQTCNVVQNLTCDHNIHSDNIPSTGVAHTRVHLLYFHIMLCKRNTLRKKGCTPLQRQWNVQVTAF